MQENPDIKDISSGSCVIEYAATPVVGNLLVTYFATGNSSDTATASAGWTRFAYVNSLASFWGYYRVATGAAIDKTFTIYESDSATNLLVNALEFSGSGSSLGPFAEEVDSPINSISLTTASVPSESLVISLSLNAVNSESQIYTQPSGYSSFNGVGSSYGQLDGAYKTATAGSQSATVNYVVEGAIGAGLYTFTQSGGATVILKSLSILGVG